MTNNETALTQNGIVRAVNGLEENTLPASASPREFSIFSRRAGKESE